MFKLECLQVAEYLQGLLEISSEVLGRVTKFVQRESKLTAAVFVKTLVLGLLENGEASLTELIQVSARLGVTISESGLAQRMNDRAVSMLRQLVQAGIEQLGERITHDKRLFKGFKAVNIVDSTQIRLPESCGSMFRGNGEAKSSAKIQVSYEYLSGTFNALSIGNGRDPDQTCTFPVDYAKPGSVTLFDLGYFKQDALAAIHQAKAFFVTRLRTQTALYWQLADEIQADVIGYIEQQKQSSGEVLVYLGAKARLPVRVIYHRLPDEQVAKKRREAQRTAKKNHRACSGRLLRFLAWQVCVTNVPAARWSVSQTLLVYRLRWQIELIFKLWKSQAKLSTLRYDRPERIACLLYAHLLGLLIFYWLIAPHRAETDRTELSPVKAFNLLQKAIPTLIRRIAARWQKVTARLARFYRDLARFAQKSIRPKTPSTRQRLLRAGI